MMYGLSIDKAKALIHQYSPNIKLRQGESGCPSEYQVKHHGMSLQTGQLIKIELRSCMMLQIFMEA